MFTVRSLEVERTLEQVLKSCSDTMFPAELGEAEVLIDSKDIEGDTPLHVMAWRKYPEGAAVLIEAGADVNAAGDMGGTPLHVALTQENEKIVELLLKSGADTGIRSEFDRTPQEIATELGGKFLDLFERYSRT